RPGVDFGAVAARALPRSRRTAATATILLAVGLATATAVAPATLLTSPAGAAGARPPVDRHVVVVILDRTTPEMMTSVGSIQSLDATGASGLMSTTNGPGDGGLAPLAGVATLSAGAAAVAPDPATVPLAVQPGAPGALTRFGPTGDLYRTRTGRQPSGAIVYPDAAMLSRFNAA